MGEKNTRFLSKTTIEKIKINRTMNLICLLCIMLSQSPMEKKIIKYGIALKEFVFINKKREQKRLTKKNSKNKSILHQVSIL
ncbi:MULTISPECIES: hypothetical protein [unclassified Treponema]|uniref:hypothetical protein n=1 Tax=unclassified Treponema TaxID=2638727 RepID=UPI0020A5A299|nr:MULTISPECIES: hypothetical protein [unclassified Treponema]